MIAKYIATALLGTALVGSAALAQTTAPSTSSQPVAAPSASVQQNLKGNWRASKLVGLSVYNDSNENLGSISEILVDNNGKIHAVIIGAEDFGLFCRLVELPIDGLLHITTLPDDYYYLEPETHTLVGRRAGVLAGHQDVDVPADLLGGGDGLMRRVLQRRIVVIGDDENGH